MLRTRITTKNLRVADRSTRDLIMIHPVDEPGTLFELGQISRCTELVE